MPYLGSYDSFSVLVLRKVRENSWNLSTFSLLLGKPNYKNPRRFLYRFDHTKLVLILKCNTVSVVSSEEFHFKMLSWPVRDVANYASCVSAISLPLYDLIQICFLYRNYQTNFIYTLKLYIAHMSSSWGNAVIQRAWFVTSRTGHDNIFKWNSSEDTTGILCYTLELIQTLYA